MVNDLFYMITSFDFNLNIYCYVSMYISIYHTFSVKSMNSSPALGYLIIAIVKRRIRKMALNSKVWRKKTGCKLEQVTWLIADRMGCGSYILSFHQHAQAMEAPPFLSQLYQYGKVNTYCRSLWT